MTGSTAPPAASTEDPQVTADLFVCPNCETTTPGPFCFHCGQKRPVDADLSLRHAGSYVVEELLNLDGRLLTTVKLLFTRPWRLTLDFFEGRRARHVHPLRLFLAFSAVFFLVRASTMTTAFESRLGIRVTSTMRAQALEEGVPFETVVARNDQRLRSQKSHGARWRPRRRRTDGTDDLLFPGPDDHPGLPARKEGRHRSACAGSGRPARAHVRDGAACLRLEPLSAIPAAIDLQATARLHQLWNPC